MERLTIATWLTAVFLSGNLTASCLAIVTYPPVERIDNATDPDATMTPGLDPNYMPGLNLEFAEWQNWNAETPARTKQHDQTINRVEEIPTSYSIKQQATAMPSSNTVQVHVYDADTDIVNPIQSKQIETPVSHPTSECRINKSQSAPDSILGKLEKLSGITIQRLTMDSEGTIAVSHVSALQPDEVLVINQQNTPQLMTVGPAGYQPHPSKRAILDDSTLYIVDNRVNMDRIRQDPVLSSLYAETRDLQSEPLPVTVTLTPIFVSDSEHSAILSEDTLGNPETIELSVEDLADEDEILVAYPASIPQNWRSILVGNGILVIDDKGIIQDIVPYNESIKD